MFKYTFDVEPVSKGRPRFGGGTVRTPQMTKKFENTVAILARRAFNGPPLTGPLELEIIFYITPPQRPKDHLPIVKPDIDNFSKAIIDALNKIVWIDDAQICNFSTKKRYQWGRKYGSIELTVTQMDSSQFKKPVV